MNNKKFTERKKEGAAKYVDAFMAIRRYKFPQNQTLLRSIDHESTDKFVNDLTINLSSIQYNCNYL